MPAILKIALLAAIAYYGAGIVNASQVLDASRELTFRRSRGSATGPPVKLFPYEALTLDPKDPNIAAHPEFLPDGLVESGADNSRLKRSQSNCKFIPADSGWPRGVLWQALASKLTDGGLLKDPTPLAAPCYAGKLYDAEMCTNVTSSWSDSDLQYATPLAPQ